MKLWIRRLCLTVVGTSAFILAVFLVEIYLAIHQSHTEPPFHNPNHEPVRLGDSGPSLTYVVIGDSTSAGRGAAYADGIAIGTAEHLSKRYRVAMTNFSVSGATAAGVLRYQSSAAAALKPDIVLISLGANDVTHFTGAAALDKQLREIIALLRSEQPGVRIVVTGCPQMGSVPRFNQPLRWFAGTQTDRINSVFAKVVPSTGVTWAHIADRTGPAFDRDPSLFASDEFHPNARGYAIWITVLDDSLDDALR